jgi:hypothetical protein
MSAKRFKVGDKARVKENLNIDEIYGGNSFVCWMAKMKGKIVTIKEVFRDTYHIKEFDFHWTDEMLEPVKQGRPMKFEIELHCGIYSVCIRNNGVGVIGYYTTASDAKRGLNRFLKKIQEGNYEIEVKK